MHALFEDAGKFLAGRILSEADASSQVELASGKRVKVKAAHILLKFEKPEPAVLMAEAEAIASTIELDLAWEFAPEEEFGFADLARDYFSDSAPNTQQIGMLFALYGAPTISAALARAVSAKRPLKSCSRHWPPLKRKSRSRHRLMAGPRNWPLALAPSLFASSCTRFCSSPTRTRPSTRP